MKNTGFGICIFILAFAVVRFAGITFGSLLTASALGFVLLAIGAGWLSRQHPDASGLSTRSVPRVFDWQTALVFLTAGLGFYWLRNEISVAPEHVMSLRVGTLILAGAVQGLWLHFRRSGPGLAWFGIVWLQLYCADVSRWVLPPGSFEQVQYLTLWAGYWALGAKVWILSRRFQCAWLLVLVRLYSEAARLWLFPALPEEARREMLFTVWPQADLVFLAIAMGIIVARVKRASPLAVPPSIKGEERVQYLNALSSLKRCRPLEDPVITVRSLSGRWGLGIGLSLLIICIPILLVSTNDDALGGALALSIPAAQLSLVGVVIFLLTPRSFTHPNAFIVRAFRRDDQTTRLRDLVSAAMGPNGRLLGIRDPRRRFGVATRLFALIEGALRYLGTNYCDLEGADRNWLARVLATLHLRAVSFVLIDLREITDAVTVEVKVVARAMTPHRVIWLMDDTHSKEEWLQKIHFLTDGGVDADAPVHLLNVNEADDPHSRAVTDVVDAVLADSAHLEHSGVSQQALVQAHTLARTHVADTEWKTPWHETLAGGFWIVVLLCAVFDLLLQGLGSPADMLLKIPLIIVGFVVLIRTLASAARAITRRRKLRQLGKIFAPDSGW